jgi:hypothetical protein
MVNAKYEAEGEGEEKWLTVSCSPPCFVYVPATFFFFFFFDASVKYCVYKHSCNKQEKRSIAKSMQFLLQQN